MAPLDVLSRADRVSGMVASRPKISVTDLARNKSWREQLPESGVIEITDRGETAGWLLSDQDLTALVEGYAYLEQLVEQQQVAALFEARPDSQAVAGDELVHSALDAFDARKDRLAAIIDEG